MIEKQETGSEFVERELRKRKDLTVMSNSRVKP